MKNIIEELYYGNLNPGEQIIPADPEYRPVNRKLTELIEVNRF
ncbi:DUF6809 family protein [Paenibacillus sp. JTLBN-2024]|nr:hypothetical protein [Paenibacillus cookii]